MYLLDTNVVSEARKAGTAKADHNVIAWLRPKAAEQFYISVMTLFEIEMGILQIARRDVRQAAALRRWMKEDVKHAFVNRIIGIDETIALRCAAYNVPDPRPLRDAFIAATAKERGFTLVTRNVRDFQGLDVEFLNPWEAPL